MSALAPVPDDREPGTGAGGAVVSHPPQPPRRGVRTVHWWGKAWVRAVEEAAYDTRDLRRGRALARSGDVGGLSVAAGRTVAAVADGDDLVTVDLRLPVLDDEARAALVEVVAAESGRIGALLSGDLPHELVEHAEESGAELLPYGGEVDATCTCTGWLDPCPHALAVLTQLGWLVDAEPLVLLHVRGLPRDALLAALHARETSLGGPDPDAALEATIDLAADAAGRATAMLALLEADSESPVGHLW